MLQTQFELRDLAGLAIGEKPVVGVAAVVAVEHDGHVVVDRRLAYCMALRARMNSGLPSGSKPLNPLMVVSVIMIPESFTPKSSSLAMTPGKPSMMK